MFHNGKIMLLVSPDGSLRALSDSTCITEPHASFAIQIKCPFPGSIYKPKVHYEMPIYYVPQIFCEMAVFEDLVGKQSNAFSRKTFSDEVEEEMRKLCYHSEAYFCHLIREWYEAEDEPGLNVFERCIRRLKLREWLCSNIHIGRFPPPGSHVNGIPVVMFEGLMTNIERRIQLFPFVKRGSYNVRALGSLEAENFFSGFQDLDPKGSGVLRQDDVSAAISTACELTEDRFGPNRYILANAMLQMKLKKYKGALEHLMQHNAIT